MLAPTPPARPLLALLLLAAVPGAQLVVVPGTPFDLSDTDNVDFGDVDLDGDWDAAFANGGESFNEQNRLWTNLGGLQGGTLGEFADTTDVAFPAFQDMSRDVEFADLEGDHDLDLYIANTAQVNNQGSRFWINQGGTQSGTVGTYVDETAARWLGLGEPGSSISPALILTPSNPETFIDWSCDADFADLDSDGDLDLFHSSYGGSFGGQVPSRIFLNDGAGYFQELNPSGFQLAGTNLLPGDPGLWAEGTQETDTTSVDGTHCDITTNGLDLELVDIDGDLDIDLLLGGRDNLPRLFTNLLEETGALVFRDTTVALFPPDWATGGGNYEQELGDVDLDGDLDLFGLNWSGFEDKLLFNDGSGRFSGEMILPGSAADDNEGDFLDYDSDGDLDLYVANWSGSDKLYRNELLETGSVAYTLVQDGFSPETTLDADAVDLDADGDPDVVAARYAAASLLLRNTTDVADVHAPYVPGLEEVPDGPAEDAGDVVRAAVLDNAAYYVNWYLDVVLEVSVDGIALPDVPMRSSAAQIFRGVLPGNFVGEVEYRVRAEDAYGNAGRSDPRSYVNTGSTGVENGGSSPSSLGVAPRLRSLSQAFAGQPVHLAADGVAAGTPGVVLLSTGTVPALHLGDGVVLNVFPFLGAPVPVTADASGISLVVGETQPGLAGAVLYFQYLGLDGAPPSTWTSSNRLRLNF